MLALSPAVMMAQKFFHLTADDVKVDSIMPYFEYSIPLGEAYADSTYTVTIDYPEFTDMNKSDIEKYNKFHHAYSLPSMPDVNKRIVVDRKKGFLEVYFSPFVYRNGKHQKLTSFMLNIASHAKQQAKKSMRVGEEQNERYVKNSVLASGNWAKIRVPQTGVYQLTEALIRKAGFNDISKVKVYGYGGQLHEETLQEETIKEYDDLKEVPICIVNGKRLFHANGTVSWNTKSTLTRTRNPYSDYGYYFITQSDTEPTTVDSTTFVSEFYPTNNDYHSLHEIDNYAWYQGGRNLFENTPVNAGDSVTYKLSIPSNNIGKNGKMYINITNGGVDTYAQIEVNDSIVGFITIRKGGEYDHGLSGDLSCQIKNMKETNDVKLKVISGGTVRLDYISLAYSNPRPEPQLSVETFATPEYVYNITNQNHHADKACDMVIIIPTSQKLRTQAERLKTFHEKHDGMRVNLVPADELFNEFSSGTPEADAYRLYLKMLYDRAETEADMPKYLMLFGDGVWDNRMNTSATSGLSPDDFLLCFESENSFNAINCFVNDGYFCALDDGEGQNASADNDNKTDKHDIAIGRIPVSTEADAKVVVDKTISYIENKNAGTWQNVAMFLGDDGNSNTHMEAANSAASITEKLCPGMQVKRVFWDMYTRESSATGFAYPEVSAIIKKQQTDGALLIDYCGHGRADELSHELVLSLNDFADFKNTVYPIWVTASCDIMPFDGRKETIGETTLLNPNGGAVAFYGTTRTVYTSLNKFTNDAYIEALFSKTNGKYATSIGEAQRIAKNKLSTGQDKSRNKLHYTLIGDPALMLNIPTENIVVDSINGISLANATQLPEIKAGSKANIKGHVVSATGEPATDFNGILNINVKDSKEKLEGKMNDTSKDGTDKPLVYYDNVKTIFNGSDSIRSDKFDITFAVTKDINYADDNGKMILFAINGNKDFIVNGSTEDFIVGGTEDISTDSIGPSIYCYLNSPSFSNGGDVNPTPYFMAELSDEDGLNTSDSGIGHNLQLTVDDKPSMTYNLNDNFSYDFGSFTKGTTFYNIPELETGMHKLKFTAWDIKNNPSTVTLKFNVVHGLTPKLTSISCTKNPATTNTTFIVNHDRGGSNVNVRIEVFDTSGRILWAHNESSVSATSTYTYDWDLCTDNGGKLQSGVYLYRVRLNSDKSSEVSKTRKLIVLN